MYSNSLLDFSFIEEGKPDFALDPYYNYSCLNFMDMDALDFRLESTLRKVTSRCIGLLEVIAEENDDDVSTTVEVGFQKSKEIDRRLDTSNLLNVSKASAMALMKIDFLHRSLHDFLLTPKVQNLLHDYTRGPYDARMFFLNARLVQLMSAEKVGFDLYSTIGLASYILCTLTVPEYRDTTSAAAVASLTRPVVENLVRCEETNRLFGLYICWALECWHDEDSTYLTLAIDFGLDSYVRAHLTPQSVQSKKGRPVLDYLLRPRFAQLKNSCVGHQLPDLAVLDAVLGFGADPNQKYKGVSIWALFMCFMADYVQEAVLADEHFEAEIYFEVLKLMIQSGAENLLPRQWISEKSGFHDNNRNIWHDEDSDERLRRRFPNTTPAIPENAGNDAFYAVTDLLENFCVCFGFDLDVLKALI